MHERMTSEKKGSWVRKWEHGNELLGLVSGFIVLGVTLAIVYEVAMRYLFNQPTIWVTESSELVLVVIAFLVLAYTLQTDGHVAVTVLKERFSEKGQNRLQIFSSIVALFFAGTLTWFSTVTAWEALHEKEIYSLTLPIPLFPFRVFIPIGSFLLCIALLIRLRSAFAALKSSKE